MIKNDEYRIIRMPLKRFWITTVLIFAIVSSVFAQEPPPRPLVVNVIPPGLTFGAFTLGIAGGSVIIDPDGNRSATGDVILLSFGYSFSSALFELIANPGTVISIVNGPDATLTGDGGGTMTLKSGLSDPASPFVMNTVPPAATQLKIGGTLMVDDLGSNPAGNYTGTFDIIFIQE
jgi:hypothetical protein